MSDFQVDDTVRSVDTTVTKVPMTVREVDAERGVRCEWFDREHGARKAWFAPHALELLKRPEVVKP